jgi:hypothetical protein
METLRDKNKPKMEKNKPFIFYCKYCDYGTCKKSNYDIHITTSKHTMVTNGYNKGQKQAKNKPDDSTHICCCGKQYQYRQGLWRHQKKCNETLTGKTLTDENPTDKQLIVMLIKENSELRKEQSNIKELILEIAKNGSITNNNHINNNCMNNNTFNLQFFLNETCKNAMNITDFVDSINLQLADLIHLGEVGYVEGISKIIVKNLNALDETERPVHCTDKKRETMYIKDANEWTKEDDNKTKLIKVIRSISNKNIKLLPQFREKYPEYKNSSSKISDTYDKMVVEAMVSDTNKDDKIIKNISKATTLN